jgi:hypothetical protein
LWCPAARRAGGLFGRVQAQEEGHDIIFHALGVGALRCANAQGPTSVCGWVGAGA